MRGWRTRDEHHPLDRSKRVQLERGEAESTLPKTIGTLEFMWKLDVSHNRLGSVTAGRSARAYKP